MSETRSTETSDPSVVAFFFFLLPFYTLYLLLLHKWDLGVDTPSLADNRGFILSSRTPPPPACAAGKSWPPAGRATLRTNKQPLLQGRVPAVLRIPSATFQAAWLLRGWPLIIYCNAKGWLGHHYVKTEQAEVDVLLTERDLEQFYHNISFLSFLQWYYTLDSDEWAAMPYPNSSQEIVFALHNKHELQQNILNTSRELRSSKQFRLPAAF